MRRIVRAVANAMLAAVVGTMLLAGAVGVVGSFALGIALVLGVDINQWRMPVTSLQVAGAFLLWVMTFIVGLVLYGLTDEHERTPGNRHPWEESIAPPPPPSDRG